ncbi:dehydrogenase [Streptomyces sp. JV178]|jgi:NAD(P)-dependent dehydrogenase (short-subunit alcohol dehydrogenase family)|uniref:SDR family NAD(P)-dependent oxidoreductase n=1 Tax=Streptomyces sp. JV178 TaxID=858632 RepID=UPI000C1B0B12|nr:SDR family NAD(P)-dependent oxidoreductase [Streptomyces sp. JV178]PIM67855.1 dehydrogenase [Streptomyces sp. JV178]
MTPDAIVLVTGANRGIGREAARQLALRGARVLLGARDIRQGENAARALDREGVHVTPVALDVTDARSATELADRLEKEHGRLDVLVNNAGHFRGATAVDTDARLVRDILDVNVVGPVAVLHALLPLLRRSPAPRVVNVSSTTASFGLTTSGADLPGDASARLAYTASKAALNMLTVQYDLAFRRDPDLRHIKINSVSPGWTATAMNDFRAPRTVEEGARALVALATLPDDGPSGGFFDEHGPLAW